MTPEPTTLSPVHLEELRAQLRGPVLQPGSDGWEEARTIWNAAYERTPAAIVRCRGAADVAATVRYGVENDLPLAVRSGGHDFAGYSLPEGGIMVDLSGMKGIRVDRSGRRARVEPGVVWGELDHETQAFGLATTGGTVSTVGVAGYTLGGGTGHLARSRGLSVDNLVSADVVTADGELRRADEAESPDLFWALRGGGGNFGIVTSLEYRLHPVGPQVMAGQIIHPLEDAREAMAFYREVTAEAPDELAFYAFFLPAPPLEVIPPDRHGKPVMVFVVAHTGALEDAREAVRPIQEFGDPLLSAVQPMPYTAAQSMFDAGMPKGNRRHSRAQYFGEISDAAIDTLLGYVENLQGPFTSAYFEPLGGAVNRVEPGATAFPHRDAQYSFHVVGDWTDPAEDERMRAWVDDFHHAMSRHAKGGVYVNLMGHDEGHRVREAYGPNYERLARIKAEHDPGNVFRMNQNIEPEG